jgi:hypothetical protein
VLALHHTIDQLALVGVVRPVRPGMPCFQDALKIIEYEQTALLAQIVEEQSELLVEGIRQSGALLAREKA